MPTKVVASQSDPQFGWVTADPSKSGEFTGYQKASDLYQQTYGRPLGAYWQQLQDPNSEAMQRVYFDLGAAPRPGAMTSVMGHSLTPQYDHLRPKHRQSYIDAGRKLYQTDLSNKTQVNDPLMQWYAAASNQDLMKDPTARAYIDYLAQPLGWDTAARKQQLANQNNWTVVGNPFVKITPDDPLHQYGFGTDPVEKYSEWATGPVTTINDLYKRYGVDPLLKAKMAVANAANISDPLGVLTYQEPTSYVMGHPLMGNPFIDRNVMKDLQNRGFSYYSMGASGNQPKWTSRINDPTMKQAAQMRNYLGTEGVVSGMQYAQANPFMYTDPALRRYVEGPNPSLRTSKNAPWSPVPGTNLSRELGGEDVAGDVFDYYKSISSQAGLPSVVGALSQSSGNPYLYTTEGGQYFTPYDYAIHGRYDPAINRANISSLGPDFWQKQGSLQNVGGQWGFVTAGNPYEGVATPNQTLGNEDARLLYRYKKKSGGLGGFGGLLSKAMSFVNPYLAIPAMVSSGVDMFSKPSGSGPGAVQLPVKDGKLAVFAPDWISAASKYGNLSPSGIGLPSARADDSRYRVPQPGDADYADYLRALASGREWYRYE